MTKISQKIQKCLALFAIGGFLFLISFQLVLASEINAISVIGLVNKTRIENGLEPLARNEKLEAAAGDKAQDMIDNNYFAHTSPQGLTPWYWIEKSGYDYKYAGENLAMNFITAEDQQKAWMASATHKRNILDSHYQEIGVAVKEGVIDKKMTTIAVQEFGSRPDFVPASAPKAITDLPKGAENKVATEKSSIPSVKGLEISRWLEWGTTGSLVILWAVALVINPAILVYMALLQLRAYEKRRKNNKYAALYTLSLDNYRDFLKDMSLDANQMKVIYLASVRTGK